MHILIVSATRIEIAPLISYLDNSHSGISENVYKTSKVQTNILITGVGMMSASYHLGSALASRQFDLVIQAGIAGAFDHDMPLGTVVEVTRDRVADLGTEHADGSFSDVFEMGLTDADSVIYQNGWMSPIACKNPGPGLRQTTAVTVNKVTGCKSSIDAIRAKYNPDMETMEGAALFYACGISHVPCLQIRSVSNHVEPRNREKWEIGLAIKNLNDVLISYISSLE